MIGWKKCTLGDLVTFQRGHDLPKSKMKFGEYPVVGSNGIIGFHNEYTTEAPSVTIGRSGNVGKPFIYYGKTWSHNTTLYVKDFKGNDPVFVYYYLKTLKLDNFAGGSAVPTLNRNHIHSLNICVPEDVRQQRVIGEFLKAFDDKIAVNDEINKNLEQQAQSIFAHRMDDAHSEGGHEGTMSEIITLHDSQRIPLSNKQRSALAKIYPYYGATSIMDYVDQYLFDGIYLLLGEDGTVVNQYGFPILQYVDGKFWVNNHAHVITGKNGFSVELLYLLFHQTNVQSIVTGAVQPKISQGNLKSIPVFIPSREVLRSLDKLIQPLFAQIRNLRTENSKLAQIRDTLLPKLLSGELDVSRLSDVV